AEVAGAAERQRVRRALASLPDVQRATLEIAFFEGLTYAEIAEREGVPLGTIKSRAGRALAALREALGAERWATLGARTPAPVSPPRFDAEMARARARAGRT